MDCPFTDEQLGKLMLLEIIVGLGKSMPRSAKQFYTGKVGVNCIRWLDDDQEIGVGFDTPHEAYYAAVIKQPPNTHWRTNDRFEFYLLHSNFVAWWPAFTLGGKK